MAATLLESRNRDRGCKAGRYFGTGTRNLLLPARGGAQDITADYDIDPRVLGEGAFGSVRKARRKQSAKTRIVKTILKENIPDEGAFQNEIHIQMDMDHPHICRIFDHFENDTEIHMVLELCCGGEVWDAICEIDCFPEAAAHHLIVQVLKGVNYMHSRQIAHRDLKPENFLLKDRTKAVPLTKSQLKIIDFGFAQTCRPGERNLRTMCGTPHYIAPEIIFGDRYDEKCDIWSCGVITYTFLCGYPPFDGKELDDIFALAKAGRLNFADPVWTSISPTAKLAIQQMCKTKPRDRFSAAAVLTSPWVANNMPEKQFLTDQLVQQTIVERMQCFSRANRCKKAVAYLVAHSLPEAKLAKMRRAFEEIDKNGDGMLTFEELKQATLQSGEEITPEAFHGIDTDRTGKVEWTEFLAALASARLMTNRDACLDAFNVIDSNRDGIIEVRELVAIITDMGMKESIAMETMTAADVDKDGTICLEEFVGLMQGIGAKSNGVFARGASSPLVGGSGRGGGPECGGSPFADSSFGNGSANSFKGCPSDHSLKSSSFKKVDGRVLPCKLGKHSIAKSMREAAALVAAGR